MTDKDTWNYLARKNYRYYIHTVRKDITEEEFVQSGYKDYNNIIVNDDIVQKRRKSVDFPTLLEIGCGAGRILQHAVWDFRYVYGVDVSDEMINLAKVRLFDYKNVSLSVNDGKVFPWIDGTFDVVFSYAVFQHVKDYSTVESNFLEAYRTLCNGGIFKVLLGCTEYRNMNTWYSGVCFTDEMITKISSKFNTLKKERTGDNRVWLWLEK